MYLKNCEHCGDEYNATKRNQKYCGNSCRTRACYQRNQYNYVRGGYHPPQLKEDNSNEEKVIEKKEVGQQGNLGDAIIGTMIGNYASNLLIDLLTENQNKPATKGDLYKVVQLINQVEEANEKKIEVLGKNQVKIYNLLNKLRKELLDENNIKGGMNNLL